MGQTPLFVADPVTAIGAFTDGIEGPACDVHGNVYAVNFHHQGTIGRIDANGEGEVYVELPSGSIGNGIRFGLDKEMFVADYTGHNILTVSGATRALTILPSGQMALCTRATRIGQITPASFGGSV
jgi:streptogramin lyase